MMTRPLSALRVCATLSAFLVLTAGFGCGDDTTPPGDGGAPRIEIGTGSIGNYEVVSDGDEALLVRGNQGGQHIWVGLRAWNLDTRPALIQLLLEGDDDGAALSIPFQVRLTFSDTVPSDADYAQLSGLSLVVPDPEAAFAQPVTIRARVAENRTGGQMAETSVSGLRVEWDPDTVLPGDDGGLDDGGLPDATAGDGGLGDAAVGDATVGDGGLGDAAVGDASAGDVG